MYHIFPERTLISATHVYIRISQISMLFKPTYPFLQKCPFPPLRIVSPSATTARNICARVTATGTQQRYETVDTIQATILAEEADSARLVGSNECQCYGIFLTALQAINTSDLNRRIFLQKCL